jgi:uncharacterized caspase-like protein/uncharacterized protein YegJ (DUF2314 family)
MKIKVIIVIILLFLFVIFTGGCLQFMEELGSITSPSLKVEGVDGVVNYWAVIVGIEDYESMTDLSYTIDDAEDMRDVLLSYGNWNDSNIQFLTDVDASKSGIYVAIENMAKNKNADADDVYLFFFSGHGSNIPDDDGDEVDSYDEVICPYDATYITTEDLKKLEKETVISDDELGTWLSACSGNIVVILDTCMSGGFATKGAEGTIKTVPNPQVPKDAIAKKHFGEGLVEHLKQRPISRDLNETGYVVLMACEEDKSAYESRRLKNGVFTYYIVEGLWGPADTDSDNNVSAEEDFSYADPLVRQYKPTNQDPQLWDGYYEGDLMLVIASPLDAGTIAGNVTEVETGSAIGGAKVAVEGTNLSATTDANGDYTINDVAEGTYTVTASATGYSEESKTAEVLKDKTTVVDFTLTPTTTSSNTMHVSNIDMSLKKTGINVSAVVTVTIVDETGALVESATVSGHWSGATNDTDSGITDIYGQVSLESDKVRNPESGEIFTFTVDDVTKDGWTYDLESSVTSGSIIVP